MTRQAQKIEERGMLDELLCALRCEPDNLIPGENPDFILQRSDKQIGVEITTYQSGTKSGTGYSRRQIEACWESLRLASCDFLSGQCGIGNVCVGLMFKDGVPSRRNHPKFMREVAAFIRDHKNNINTHGNKFSSGHFSSPLMQAYLRSLHLRTTEFAEWCSNINTGWVARPGAILEDIVIDKSIKAKTYSNRYHELWLLVYSSHRISETVLPREGIADLNAISLPREPFTKIYLLTMHGNFQWDPLSGWASLPVSYGPTGQEGDLDCF